MKRGFGIRIFIALVVILVILPAACKAESEVTVGGTVFEDLDGDGIMDAGEGGIPDILVSNGITVTVTDEGGSYQLPQEGYFVFITTPNDYTTTTWYRGIAEENLDFGLSPAPEKDRDEFVFVQITDIHLDTEEEHIAIFEQAIEEINDIAPAFVIATGDLVLKGDAVTISQAREWFDTYSSSIRDLEMPIYNVLGNHDVVGIHCEQAAETEPGYNEEMYRDYFGPTYYSFDWGPYHYLILDPNELVDGRQLYRIPDSQLEWLQQDLAHRQRKPLLVFFHEPTTSWENRTQVLNLLKQHQAMLMFSGHWHFDILMDSYGILEQVTGAICAEWWLGPGADGSPFGYRIIDIGGEAISTFYKGVGEERAVDITSPEAIASGEIVLTAQLYTEHGAIREACYSVDGGQAVAMQIEEGAVWDTATALWDTTRLAAGYHTIAIEARDEEGTFSQEVEVKVSEEEVVPIGELISHFGAYRGQYATVRGEVVFAVMGPPFAEEGTGAIVISDETGGMVIVTGECIAPLPPPLAAGDVIEVKALPLQYSMESIEMSDEFGMIQQYAHLLPEGLLVGDVAAPEAVRLMRLLSGDDVQKIHG